MKEISRFINILDTIDFFIENPECIAPTITIIVIVSLIGICAFGWATIKKILAGGIAAYIALQGVFMLFDPNIDILAKGFIAILAIVFLAKLVKSLS